LGGLHVEVDGKEVAFRVEGFKSHRFTSDLLYYREECIEKVYECLFAERIDVDASDSDAWLKKLRINVSRKEEGLAF
jgi:hypothetical protein